MLNPKTFLPFIFGLISLLVSLGIANQETGEEVNPLPLTPPLATPLSQIMGVSGAANSARCQALSQPRFFFYILPMADEAEPYLPITGAIYASDMTPLSDALIEVWRADPEQGDNNYTFHLNLLTDEAGYYKFTDIKPTRPERPYLHYKFAYRDYCPLVLHLHLVTKASSKPVKQPVFAKVVEITGPVLQGPLDIVLPVPSTGR